jgi:hypothetical protein
VSSYADFLTSKVAVAPAAGFTVDAHEVNPALFGFQARSVRWALAGGRRALFQSFGLGKSAQQLEAMRLVGARLGGRQLIVCPLGVRGEFARDAEGLLGMEPPRFVRRTAEVDGDGLFLTNYESIRDGRLDARLFDAVSLDEAAVLRNFGSKTSQLFSTAFAHCPIRLVATATPSPNEYRELFEYAHFLGVMDRGQCMTRFTKRDSEKANHLTLLPTMEEEFWRWIASWALFITTPALICECSCHPAGGPCEACPCGRYVLPGLDVEWIEVATPPGVYGQPDRDGQGRLVADAALGVTAAATAKRDTLTERVEQMAGIVAEWEVHDPGCQFLVWCDLNAEQTATERALLANGISYSSVHGSLSDDEVERRLEDWRGRRTRALIAKPVMLGEGLNLQQASKAVFLGVSYKFSDVFQALHRVYRFGQSARCDVRFVHAEAERGVVAALRRKWTQHDQTGERMAQIITEHGLDRAALETELRRSLGVERVECSGEGWRMVCNDTVPETTAMDEGSVGLIVTSIPFGTLYEYSTAIEDFGHSPDTDTFWSQMDYLTPDLLRVLAPGRIYACHVKDRIVFGNTTGAGYSMVDPFHAEAILHYRRHGFDFLGQITVVTDVVRENNQSYRLGWTEQCKDGTRMGVGTPEYVLIFRKPQSDRSQGRADVPVVKDKEQYSRARWQTDAHAFWRDSGNRPLCPEDFDGLSTGARSKLFASWTRSEVYDYELHVRIGERIDAKGQLPATFMCLAPGSPHPDVWSEDEVLRFRTLNTEQARRRLDQHVCPMPFGIADRLINRYSNPGDVVYDPFAGIGTVPRQAVLAGRIGWGTELCEAYFRDAVGYLAAAERQVNSPTLFDLIEAEAAS